MPKRGAAIRICTTVLHGWVYGMYGMCTLGFFFFEVGSLWYVHFSGRVGGGEVGRLEVGFCWLRVTDCLSEIVVGVGEDLSCRVGCVPEELKCL